MKKVLYIGGFCMPDGNAAAQRVLGIAKILRECEHEVRFCGLTKNDSIETGVVDGFRYTNYRYPHDQKSWFRYLTGRDSSINEIKSYVPDIVILYNHPAFAIEHIYHFCSKRGIKVVGDVTEWYEPSGNKIFKAIKGLDINRRMYTSHLQLDGLICISSYLSLFYRNRNKNIIELPPLVDFTQSKWKQNKNDISNDIRIIYAGSPGDNKDRLDLILSALDEINPDFNSRIHFDIIGMTKHEYQNKWLDYTERSYISFHGRQPHEKVIGMLLNSDFQVFLRPDSLSNKAGFPTKFVETITSSTIPITNLNSNLIDYLIDGKNGYIIKTIEKNSIKETLLKALSSSRNKIGEMKNNIDNKTFDYRRYITQVSKWLESL